MHPLETHPVMQMLADKYNRSDLLKKLHSEVLENKIDEARATAALIEAINEIKFDLLKSIKENEPKS